MAEIIRNKYIKQKEVIINQLKITPIIQIACKKCEIVRSSFYRWIKDDPNFAAQVEAAIEEGTNIVNEMAESALISSIKDNNMTGIMFWLRNRHPSFKTRLELTTKTDEKLTDEQKETIKKALSLADLNLEEGQNETKQID